MHELPVDVKSQAVDLRKASKMMLEFLLFAVFFAVALIGLVFYLYPVSELISVPLCALIKWLIFLYKH